METLSVPLKNISQLMELAAPVEPKSIVIPGGDRPEDLEVVKMLAVLPFVKRCLLVGNPVKIREAARAVGAAVSDEDIIAAESELKAAEKTVELVDAGIADMILKGNISTPILNRQILRLSTGGTMSFCTLFQSPLIADNRPVLLTDPGVTTVCNFSRMSSLIRNAGRVAALVMGLDKPNVALLSANEKVIQSLPSTVLARDLTEAHWEGMTVYGPLSLDLATSKESVRLKGFSGAPGSAQEAVVGKADILVAPGLDAANILYKAIMALVEKGEARTAGITMGVKVPYIILSRSDKLETKLNSVALCALFSEQQKKAASKTSDGAASDGAPIILTINPGSASTKLGLFQGAECLEEYTVNREAKMGLRGDAFTAEVDDYMGEIKAFMQDRKLDAVVGSGGCVDHEKGAVREGVCQVAAVRDCPDPDHPSSYGAPIAAALAAAYTVPAYMTGALVADDSRISGYKGIERCSTGHFLSLKAMAAKAAEQLGRTWNKVSLVCTHMGEGITMAAYRDGKIVDSSIALPGGRAFSPKREGALPMRELTEICFSSRFTKEELFYEFSRHGGLVSCPGEDDMRVIEQRIDEGDEYAFSVVDAIVCQISKEIGAMLVAAGRQTEALVFSGGLARSQLLMGLIKKRVGHLAPIMIFKEDMEMQAMARGTILALSGEAEINEYKNEELFA